MQHGISQVLFVCVVSAKAGIWVPFWCRFGAVLVPCVPFLWSSSAPRDGDGVRVCSPRRLIPPDDVFYPFLFAASFNKLLKSSFRKWDTSKSLTGGTLTGSKTGSTMAIAPALYKLL